MLNALSDDNLFGKIDNNLTQFISSKLNDSNIEFKTFLVGSRVDKDIIRREQEIREEIDVDVENIKRRSTGRSVRHCR